MSTSPGKSRRSVVVRPQLRMMPGDLVPGTRLEVVRWLGHGGMGVVFEVRNLDIDRHFAAKLLHETQNPARAQRFRREAKTIGKIGSPYVVDIFDFRELPDGRLMYLMELVRGVSLDRMLKKDGRLPLPVLIGIARQICKGLADAHRVGVVHRDIKPENVMVAEVGGRRQVKIVDFGLASLLDGDTEVICAGTPAYMAPEQVRGEVVDARADLYSLGIMLYKLACGRAPFVADSERELMQQHLERQASRPSTAVPEAKLPPAFDALVLRCMAKHPDERFAGAAELEAALLELQLELGIRTDVDDLPVPDVEPKQQARLERELARLRAHRRLRGRGLLLGLGFAAGTALGYYVESRAIAERATLFRVLALDDRARAAADAQRWVYPPYEAPEAETAYRVLLELDAIAGEHASTSADNLRVEFRDALLELGDDYWERPGGRSFAREFYAQALVFDPSEPRAQARAGLSRTAVEGLRSDAATLEFESHELAALASLAALAADDPELRAERLTALGADIDALPLGSVARLDRLVAGLQAQGELASLENRSIDLQLPSPVVTSEDETSEGAASEDETSGGETSEGETSEGETGGANAQPNEPEPSGTPNAEADDEKARAAKRSEAQQLVESAEKAYASGSSDEAERLFHRALELDRGSVAAVLGLYELHFERGEYRDALAYAERARALQPKRASHAIAVGDACMKVLDYDCARTQYRWASEHGEARAAKRLELLDARTKP